MAPAGSVPEKRAILRKEGEYWAVGYEGQLFRIKDIKGLSYLATLLRHPGHEFHALDLASSDAPVGAKGAEEFGRMSEEELSAYNLTKSSLSDGGEMLDDEAKAAYKRRLAELGEELEETKEQGRVEQAEKIEDEIEALKRELSRAAGLGGRDRRAVSAAERARQNVTRTIKAAIDKVGESDRELGLMLSTSVRTGTTCSYYPDPRSPISWQFEPETHAARNRRLAAILSADAAGYSRMMAEDEAATVAAIKAARELIGGRVEQHHGRVVDASGDNLLAEFPSASHAVRCAVEIQREFADRDRDVSPSRRMEFRIGIHLGEVIGEEGRIYGDAVNIAARLEALAASGGICISHAVYEQIRNKLDVACDDLGDQQVKNIAEPVRILRVRTDSMRPAPEPQRRPNQRIVIASVVSLCALAAIAIVYLYIGRARHPTSAIRPSSEAATTTVAVLPFANLSMDKNDEYFSDGMTDDIRGDLSRIAGLQVTARTSSFAFKGKNEDASRIASLLHVRNLLEGSVRRTADKVRIEVELIDASNGFTVWSERYDEKIADMFQVQSDVAENVATTLRVRLVEGVKERLEKRPTDNLEAYNLYLQGRYYLSQFSEDGWSKAVDAFGRAIEKDPNFALAYAGLADAYGLVSSFTMAPRDAIPKVRAAVERALVIDDSLGPAHGTRAYSVLFSYDWKWAAADREFKRALELDPSNALLHSNYGEFLDHMGRFEEALRQTQRAYQLNPLGVQTVLEVGWVYRDSGDHEHALEYFKQAMEIAPNNPFGYLNRGLLRVIERDFKAAVPDFEKAAALGQWPLVEGWLGLAYAQAGRRTDALKVLSQLKEQSGHRYVDPLAFAAIYLGLGEKDQAFQWIDIAYEERSYFMTTLRLPFWNADPTLRSDPRFQAIYKKVGLPE